MVSTPSGEVETNPLFFDVGRSLINSSLLEYFFELLCKEKSVTVGGEILSKQEVTYFRIRTMTHEIMICVGPNVVMCEGREMFHSLGCQWTFE